MVDEDTAFEHTQDGVPAGQDALVADPDATRHTQGEEVFGVQVEAVIARPACCGWPS